MASEVGKTQVSKTLKGKKLWVSVDNSVDEVIQWDKEGATLLFRHEPSRFLTLDPTGLSAANKQRYLVAKEMNAETDEEDDALQNIMGKIDFDVQGMQAIKKMDVPKDSQWMYGWRTADTLPRAIAKGWQVVTNEVTTVNPAGKGQSHLIGKNGKTEQVMVKIRRDKYAEMMRKGHEAVESFVNGEEAKMREEINRKSAGSDLDADPRSRLTEAVD